MLFNTSILRDCFLLYFLRSVEKKVKNKRGGVSFTNFQVFGNIAVNKKTLSLAIDIHSIQAKHVNS